MSATSSTVPLVSDVTDLPPHPERSYSRRETPSEIWRNRVGVTGTLFAVAMTASYLLGRKG